MSANRGTWFLMFVLAAPLGPGVLTATQKSPPQAEALLESAKQKELVEGKLQDAIQLYQRIVQDFAANRPVAAKALLRMGQCYERLGQADARKTYERLVREFGDQQETVTEARTRLAALAEPSGQRPLELSVRQVWAGRDADLTGSPSADGRFLSTTDWKTGDVAIRDLATGEMRRVTKTADVMQSNIFALNAIYSPDNQQIAYAWFDPKKFQGFDLWLTGVDGTGARLLYHDGTASVFPDAWTPDGKNIIAEVSASKEKVKQIVLVSAANGSARVLKSSIPDRVPMETSVSPDGRSLVYDMPQADGKRDIFLFSLPDGPETRLVEHPADDGVPIWQPDGEKVLFMSDRTGSPALWAQKVADGKSLVYVAMNIASGSQPIVVRDLQTGQEKVITKPSPTPTGMALSPDGQQVAVTTADEASGRHTVMVVPVAGGAAREIYGVDKPRAIVRLPAWTADGRQILCAVTLQDKREYFLVPVDGGEPQKVASPMSGITDLSFHPDGQRLAFSAGRSQSEVWVMENFLPRVKPRR